MLLGQNADGVPRHQPGLTVGALLNPRHDLEQGGFTGAVRADDADLRPRQEA